MAAISSLLLLQIQKRLIVLVLFLLFFLLPFCFFSSTDRLVASIPAPSDGSSQPISWIDDPEWFNEDPTSIHPPAARDDSLNLLSLVSLGAHAVATYLHDRTAMPFHVNFRRSIIHTAREELLASYKEEFDNSFNSGPTHDASHETSGQWLLLNDPEVFNNQDHQRTVARRLLNKLEAH